MAFNEEFVKTVSQVIKDYGCETVKKWAQSSDPTAEMFKRCLEAAGVNPK